MKIVNIIVILLSVCSNFCAWGQQKNVNQLSREEEKDGFQLLFDGQSLNNWINNAEEYLSELYGDDMTLPPENERVSHHKFEAYYIYEEE